MNCSRPGNAIKAQTFALGLLTVLACTGRAAADEGTTGSSTWPNIYLDLGTTFAAIPANSLSLGFGNFAALSTSASRYAYVTAPLSIDVSDRLTIYSGVSGYTAQSGSTPWTSFILSSWNVGFSADIIEQNGPVPTVTVQSTFTKSIDSGSIGLGGSALSTIVEATYGIDEDQTRGILGGIRYTHASVDSALIRIGDSLVGYAGGFYQWDNNWKLTGRAGLQSFGGAQIANLIQFPAFTQPIVRLDLDRLDDNDNRLFGVALEVAWIPKPAVQLILSTPLYAVRNRAAK